MTSDEIIDAMVASYARVGMKPKELIEFYSVTPELTQDLLVGLNHRSAQFQAVSYFYSVTFTLDGRVFNVVPTVDASPVVVIARPPSDTDVYVPALKFNDKRNSQYLPA